MVLEAFAPDLALAATLRRMREERGIAREALAFRSGITAGALARIELAQAVPRWNTVRRIAIALNVDMVELSAAVEQAAAGSRSAQASAVAGPRSTARDRAVEQRIEDGDSRR